MPFHEYKCLLHKIEIGVASKLNKKENNNKC